MIRTGMTIKEAAQEWVNGFNAIPQSVIEKLMKLNEDEVNEITPPAIGDRVYIYSGEYDGERGEIIATPNTECDRYIIELDSSNESVEADEGDFEVERDGYLPMWGTMWSFGDNCDNWWIEEKEGLQAMANCGFRIYEQEDFGYIFGIDGAGYDFYEAHWIPLYKARGLQWHDPSTEMKEVV